MVQKSESTQLPMQILKFIYLKFKFYTSFNPKKSINQVYGKIVSRDFPKAERTCSNLTFSLFKKFIQSICEKVFI